MRENKYKLERFHIIDKCLNNSRHPFPTKAYMAEICSEKLEVEISESTIEKDIAQMKRPFPIGYDAPIVYSKIEKGYVYDTHGFSISKLNLEDKEWEALQYAVKLLHQYKEVPIFANFKAGIERMNTRFNLGMQTNEALLDTKIQFEQPIATKGMNWIDKIFEAIEGKCGIAFSYHNIYKQTKNQYQLFPYLLKEHRNRWYVIGWSDVREKYLTFALDRINDLSFNKLTHKRRRDFNANQFFEYATGIMKGAEEPTIVELTILAPINKLVLLEPIHQSQQVIDKNNKELKITLNVLVNEEFYLKILSMGTYCIVNKPETLKKKIKEKINAMQKNYR